MKPDKMYKGHRFQPGIMQIHLVILFLFLFLILFLFPARTRPNFSIKAVSLTSWSRIRPYCLF